MTTPTRYDQHIPMLDILRGFAVFGIVFVNIQVSSGFYLSPSVVQAQLSSFSVDQAILFLSDIFFNYKLYTLFSFLFGLGFSILLARAQENPKFMSKYLLRLGCLFVIGWIHALFIFFGDILRIYAVAGVFLLLVRHFPDRKLLTISMVLLAVPLLIALCNTLQIFYIDPSVYVPKAREAAISAYQNGPWSAYVASNFNETIYYLSDNFTSRRFFKILGLFILGFYVGRKQVFHHLHDIIAPIQRILPWAWIVSLSMNVICYFTSHDLNPFVNEILYALCVYPLAFTYVITLVYLCHHWHGGPISMAFASLGRMSLTIYIFENLFVDIFMLWYGFGLSTQLHIYGNYLVASAVIVLLMIFSVTWLKFFKKGPLELLMQKVLNN